MAQRSFATAVAQLWPLISRHSKVLGTSWNSILFKAEKQAKVLLAVSNQPKKQWIHLSAPEAAKRRKADPVRFKPKPIDRDAKVIPISPNMTIAEIAESMEKSIDHVFEILLYVEDGEKYDKADSKIENIDIIKEIVKRSGMKFIPAPKRLEKVKENKDIVRQDPPDSSVLVKRPSVVTIMGHVDHGKTTLLDALRKTDIVSQEFGGITQHIGAFSVNLPSGEKITFLDTPGHAAFFAMRARGALLTDIVVLVVAADDSVMLQTIESIQHAQNANVPLIVAINKIDQPQVDIEKTRHDLLTHNVTVEQLGGDVPSVPISALQGTNLLELCETIAAVAEVMELKGDPTGLVEGRIVESRTDPYRGKLATVIVRRGTLKRGDLLIAGQTWVKVRAMFDDKGLPVQKAGPSTPVEVIGWKDLPSAGEEMLQVKTEQRLKEALNWRKHQEAEVKRNTDQAVIDQKRQEARAIYESELQKRREAGRKRSFRKMKTKEAILTHDGPQLSIVLKGDVDGSLEAIMDTLDTYKSEKCRLDILHFGIGNITANDIEIASAFKGIILGFHVKIDGQVAKMAQSQKVPVRMYNVIYKLFEDLKDFLSEQLPDITKEEVIGQANILEVFQVTVNKKKTFIAGCRCTKGSLQKNCRFKIVRGEEVIFDGGIISLKHFKQEVDVIKTDFECGLSFDDPSLEFQRGDQVLCYQEHQVTQRIDWDIGF